MADTIADSKHGETEELLRLLRGYNEVAQGRASDLPDFSEIAQIQENDGEAELLGNVKDVIGDWKNILKGTGSVCLNVLKQ